MLPPSSRYDRTPCPSSGNDAATHCTRCTGEPSRAREASTDAHAPTLRSCSSAPRRAKLLPRSASTAVRVRPERSCTTPMSCHSARRSRRDRRASMRPPSLRVRPGTQSTHDSPPEPAQCAVGTRPASAPADRNGQPLVARTARHRHGGKCAIEHEDADRGGNPCRVGLPSQHQHGEDQADGDRHDLTRPPPGQCATSLPRSESEAPAFLAVHVAPPAPGAPDVPSPPTWPWGPWPGGHAAGSHLICGPCPSSPPQ